MREQSRGIMRCSHFLSRGHAVPATWKTIALVLSNLLAAFSSASVYASVVGDKFGVSVLPPLDEYCRDAQRVVTRTEQPVELIVQDSFDAFVSSKAVIEGPTIQQYNWYDDGRQILGVSCKIKSADHLNLTFGDGTAGPDGLCQDMNRAVYGLVAARVDEAVFDEVVFDPLETVVNEDQPGMTGPDWLKPYTMTYVDDANALHIRAKGFQVDFTDQRFQRAPARFRGIHYCHFIAPAHLEALLRGEARPGAVIGQEVDPDRPMPDR